MDESLLTTIINNNYPAGPWRTAYLASEDRWSRPENPWHQYGRCQNFTMDLKPGLGYATAFIDDRLMFQPSRCGLIGHLEATDQQAFARALQLAEAWLRDQGCRHAVGPVNWSIFHHHRFLVDGAAPTILEPNNPTWYPAAMLRAGYKVHQEYMTATRQDLEGLLKIISPALDHVHQQGIDIIQFDTKEIRTSFEQIYDVTRQSFEDDLALTRISLPEFTYLYQPYLETATTSLVYVARDKGQIIGYLFALRDPQRPAALLMKTVAVAPAYQRRHVAIALAAQAHQDALQNGCTSVEYLLVRVGNNVSSMPYPGVSPIRRFKNFVKTL